MHIKVGDTTRVFVGRGFGRGMASYERSPGYTASMVPTKVGARYFFPDPEYDATTDEAVPAAMGNKWDGGKAVYRERVYAAAKKVGKEQGLKPAQIAELKPKVVA